MDGKQQLLIKILYIISMAIAFTTQYGNIHVSYQIQITIGIVWIFFGVIKFVCHGVCFKETHTHELITFLKLYLFPHIVIHLYTLVLIMIGIVEKKYMTSNLTVYVPVILAVVVMYLFGKSAFKVTYLALILSWLVSLFCSILVGGISIVPNAIKQGYLGYPVRNYLELHDMVFGLGYVLIYVRLTKKKITKYDFMILASSLVIILLGVKRIQIVALLLTLIIGIIFRFVSTKTQYSFCVVGCILLFILSYFFVYAMSNASFVEYIASVVDMKGRNYYYTEILKFSEFNLTYKGIGRNVVTKLLTTKYSYMKVAGVHSDIVKMYVENGFLLFGFWLWYYLFHIRHFFKKKYGRDVAIVYSMFTIYTFILYFTDNIEIYFITQIMNMILMMTLALRRKDEIRRKISNE